jgi:hypothetical protein
MLARVFLESHLDADRIIIADKCWRDMCCELSHRVCMHVGNPDIPEGNETAETGMPCATSSQVSKADMPIVPTTASVLSGSSTHRVDRQSDAPL